MTTPPLDVAALARRQLSDYDAISPGNIFGEGIVLDEAAAYRLQSHVAQLRSERGERVIGYGHVVSNDGLDTLGTTFFMQLDDRAAVEEFLANEPLNKAGVFERIDIHRWSNSFQKRAADYKRKGMQQFLCTGSKITNPAALFAAHLHAHESYFKTFADSFIFRGPIRSADGADNIGTALLLELPDRAAAEDFWNNEPFAANDGYQDDWRIHRWVFGD